MITLAAFGCAHLGYAPKGLRRTLDDGTNVVAADGYTAYRTVMTEVAELSDATDHPVAMIDGGDLFHKPHPTPADVAVALDGDAARIAAGVPRFDIPGNHDRTSAAGVPATAVMASQTDCHVVAPTPTGTPDTDREDRQVVAPGLYEVWTLEDPTDGTRVHLHLVNEQALAPAASDMEPGVDPRPLGEGINVLVTHGIIPSADGLMYHHGGDERGGERVIPADWFDRGFTLAILSDFHSPTAGTDHGTPWFYTGSLVRRGFSDAECERGWFSVDFRSDGAFNIELHPVAQRPAFDLDVDVTGMDAAGASAAVAAAVSSVPDTGAIIRVTVTGSTPEVSEALNGQRDSMERNLAPEALSLRIRVSGTAETISEVLESMPTFGDETAAQALRRMASDGVLPELEGLDPAEVAAILDACESAIPA